MIPQVRFRNVWAEGDRAIVRTEGGDEIEIPSPPCYFVRGDQADRLPGRERRGAATEGGYARVRRDLSETPEQLRDRLAPLGIAPLEADVGAAERALAESALEPADHADWLWMDIETDDRVERPFENLDRLRVLSVGFRGADGRRGFWRLEKDTDAAEEALLGRIADVLQRGRLVLAWNGDGFDFPVLRGRARRLGVEIDWRRALALDYLEVYRRNDRVAGEGGERQSYALDAVARAVVGRGKVPLAEALRARGIDPGASGSYAAWSKAPDLLEEYNLADVDLLAEIEERRGFLALHLAMCRLCCVPPSGRTIHKSVIIDGLMLRRGARTGYHWPTRYRDSADGAAEAYRGGFVMESAVGLYDDVCVLDYARLYPSIIRACNLSPDTIDAAGSIAISDETREVGRWRADPLGQFPMALEELLAYRGQLDERRSKEEAASPAWHRLDRLSQACKAAINSFYGVLGARHSRFHSRPCAEATTAVARRVIHRTVDLVAASGLRVIAADTDSVFFPADVERARAVQDQVNESARGWLAELGVPPERVGLLRCDFEKAYGRLVLCATKRYAGRLSVAKGKAARADAKLDVKGLEYIRADNCGVGRRLQERLLRAILDDRADGEVALRLVVQWRTEILAGQWDGPPADWVISQTLTKPLKEYTADPPHVAVARQMRERGEDVSVGTKIRYVLRRGAAGPQPSPADAWGGDLAELALPTYWEKRVASPLAAVLRPAFPGRDWDRELVDASMQAQASLFPADPPAAPPPPRRRAAARPVHVRLPVDGEGEAKVRALHASCAANPGKSPLVLTLVLPSRVSVVMDTKVRVSPFEIERAARRLGGEVLP